ncbi:S8 family serine peptidase [Mycoplasma sp. E35C]|uniref:S8 family serine peptidase n=1 Tax=Mycoplasma sp. E35C TaxID=2801918 RepID=UPI001CA44D41|nr:S8 family serine peptidase [Mycoplasma sp. E35C]QZX49112.1 S8 family serine peptidase [Mycoplasma sp. E35C]
MRINKKNINRFISLLSLSSLSFSFIPLGNINISKNIDTKQQLLNKKLKAEGRFVNTSFIKKNEKINKIQSNFSEFNKHDETKKSYFFLIEVKRDVNALDLTSITELIKNRKSIQSAKKSLAVKNLIFVSAEFERDNEFSEFKNFLDNSSFVENYELHETKLEVSNNFVSTSDSDYYGYENPSNYADYSKNFLSNNYTKKDRDEAIQVAKWKSATKFPIGVAILETGDGGYGDPHALIDNTNTYYFDSSNKVINNFSNYWEPLSLPQPPKFGDHSTKVASIVGGKSGVNPMLELYGIKYSQTFGFNDITGLDNEIGYILKNKNIRVVNASLATKYGRGWYEYNIYSRYIDLVAKDNSGVIFVFAAGNDGDKSNKKLTDLQLSYNSIIVGANDFDKNRTDFSSYGSDTPVSPLLLANGYGYNFKDQVAQGTSFAAPFVSGVVANSFLLASEKYNLGYASLIAKSVLGVSTTNINGDKSNQFGLNSEYGAGVLDYSKINEALKNVTKVEWNKNQAKSDIYNNVPTAYHDVKNNEASIKDVDLKKGNILRTSLSWFFDGRTFYNSSGGTTELQQVSLNFNTITRPAVKNFDLIIKNSKGEIVSSSKSYNNYEFIRWEVPEDDKYSFVIKRDDGIKPDEVEQLVLTHTVE